jgi:2'-5' RNA ligase
MRMFVALVPPGPAVGDLDAFLAVRRESAAFRWTPAEHLHLTVAFLAEVPDRRLDDLAERLGEAAARRTPFTAVVAGGGAFPDPARARVLYAGLDLADDAQTELDRLAVGCRTAGTRAGLEVDGQRFRPHVTIARCGRPSEVTPWVRLLDGYRGPAWQADAITLLASHLGGSRQARATRGRPRYEEVGTFALGRD